MLGRILSAGARPHLRITLLMLLAGLLAVGCGLDKPKGQVKFITVDTDPDWSPDGRLIAFASSRRLGGIHLIQPDGKRLRQLFLGDESNVVHFFHPIHIRHGHEAFLVCQRLAGIVYQLNVCLILDYPRLLYPIGCVVGIGAGC